jgi:hypothetical protein
MKSEKIFFKELRKYLRGLINIYELESAAPNDISEIKRGPNLYDTLLIIDYGGRNSENELLEVLGLSEDDIWFMNSVLGPYSSYEFEDSYNVKQEFQEGYYLSDFLNDENLERLNELCESLFGKKYNSSDWEDRSEIQSKIYEMFQKETDNLIDDLSYDVNRARTECVTKSIEKDFEEIENDLNISFWDRYTSISISAGEMVHMYARTGQLKDPPKEVILDYIKKTKKYDYGGFQDLSYECDYYDFVDKDSVNRNIERWLDSLFESIEELSEDSEFSNQEIIQMFDRVKSKFPVGQWHKLPKDKKVQFKLKGVNFSTGKLIIELSAGKIVTKEISEENFYNLLYQPTLFDFDELI